MTTLTYGTDVGPHLKRALMYRRKRLQRWEMLHPHDPDDYDPYAWARKAGRVEVLFGVVALLFLSLAKFFSSQVPRAFS